MPYVPSVATDESLSGRSVGSGLSLSGGQSRRPDDLTGIARYFKPQPKGSQYEASHPIPAPVQSPPPQLSRNTLQDSSRLVTDPNKPSTPILVRRPSTIAVVINTSSKRTASEATTRDAPESSLEAFRITSDLNPPQQGRSTTPLPSRGAASMEPSPKARRPRGRPPKTPISHGHSSTTKPQVFTDTTAAVTPIQFPAIQPPKRRGRPVGWRPGMGSYSAMASFPRGPSVRRTAAKEARSGPPKRRGRPPGRPGIRPTRAIFETLRPQYVPFLCEWDGCPAELQNVDTLRRHILVVHGDIAVEEGCRWRKCKGLAKQRFRSDAEFEQHIEDRHLTPFVWHVGDGPRNTVIDYKVKAADEAADDLPGYLFDAEGNQVTPSVLQQEFENEEDRKERRRRLRRLISERDRHAPEEAGSEADGKGNILEPEVDHENTD